MKSLGSVLMISGRKGECFCVFSSALRASCPESLGHLVKVESIFWAPRSPEKVWLLCKRCSGVLFSWTTVPLGPHGEYRDRFVVSRYFMFDVLKERVVIISGEYGMPFTCTWTQLLKSENIMKKNPSLIFLYEKVKLFCNFFPNDDMPCIPKALACTAWMLVPKEKKKKKN